MTVVGLLVGIAGSLVMPSWAGAALVALSILVDCIDGPIARRLGPTELGAVLDWWSDTIVGMSVSVAVALSAATPWALAAGCGAMVAVIACQAVSLVTSLHWSGRTQAFVVATVVTVAAS